MIDDETGVQQMRSQVGGIDKRDKHVMMRDICGRDAGKKEISKRSLNRHKLRSVHDTCAPRSWRQRISSCKFSTEMFTNLSYRRPELAQAHSTTG